MPVVHGINFRFVNLKKGLLLVTTLIEEPKDTV